MENIAVETSFSQPRLLLVDDDAGFRENIEEILDRSLIQHVSKEGGADAIKELIHNKKGFDCVLLDMHMGGISGVDTARMIKKLKGALPIVMMGTGESLLMEITARTIGSNCHYIKKPFSEEELVDALRRSISAPTGGR